MATIAELDGYRFETVRGVMDWSQARGENKVESFVRLVRKSDGAHIDYGLDYGGDVIASLLLDHVHGRLDREELRDWAAQEEKNGKQADMEAEALAEEGKVVEPYWIPARDRPQGIRSRATRRRAARRAT